MSCFTLSIPRHLAETVVQADGSYLITGWPNLDTGVWTRNKVGPGNECIIKGIFCNARNYSMEFSHGICYILYTTISLSINSINI